LTSPNGTQYRLIVDNSGNLSTVSVWFSKINIT
jgi:hypothetical protein